MSNGGIVADEASRPAAAHRASGVSRETMSRSISLFLCGASLGGFVGVMVGLSSSPIVASVVSALVGLVVAYATATLGGGLREALESSNEAVRSQSIAVQVYLAGFSFIGTLALLVGLYMRTHNSLSPTPREIVEQWMEAGLTEGPARQVAMELWITKAGAHDPADEGAKHLAPASIASVLMGGDTNPCDRIVSDVARKQWDLVEHEFQHAGGDWTKRYEQVRGLEDGERHAALTKFAEDTCAGTSVK